MPDIVLATVNAKYAHSAMALRCLYMGLEGLRERAAIREFTLAQSAVEIAEALLQDSPRIIGLSVYIWNAAISQELVRVLRRLVPGVTIVLGGPEVSHELPGQPWTAEADHVITGEGEITFAWLCREILEGRKVESRVLKGQPPDLATVPLPYAAYTDDDLRHRVVYVEASRGCPFRCEFCLSSLDEKVRPVPLTRFLGEMESLLARGVRQFKFIDRTFNLNVETGKAILQFFLERYTPGLFLHFEMIPDRLPEALREPLARFPPGAVQLEIGIQTFDAQVGKRISRFQNDARLEDNLKFLRTRTGVHLHTDLIVGLPGETLEGFGRGFDTLVALRPHEIQVGILKRLRGTPIIRHESEWALVFNPAPPYEILSTKDIPFFQMQRLRRFARYWELFHNSGNFSHALPFLWKGKSPFQAFLAFSDWLFARTRRTSSLSLGTLAELYFTYLLEQGHPKDTVGPLVASDYLSREGRHMPGFLEPFGLRKSRSAPVTPALPPRQARHLRPE